MAQVKSKHAEFVTQAILDLLESDKEELNTITFDNGKEFAYHEKVKEKRQVETYFAHPYRSWERGINENHNVLIRQYLPKGIRLDKVTQSQVIEKPDKINNRPQKLLVFETPNEVYQEMLEAI